VAKIINKKRKSGYVISVQRFGLNTMRQTHTDKKREVERICSEINSRELLVQKDSQHPFHTEWSLQQKRKFICYGTEPVEERLTVRESCERFIQSRRDIGKSYTTVKGYEHHLRRVQNYFGEQNLDSLNSQKLQEFLNWLSKQEIKTGKNIGSKLSPESQKKIMDRFKQVTKWSISQGLVVLSTDMFDCLNYSVEKQTIFDRLEKWCYFGNRVKELTDLGIDLNTEGVFRNVILSKVELKEHLEYLKQKLWDDGTTESRRLFCTVKFCCVTGCRRGELVRVRRSDVRLDDLQVVIWRR